MDLTFTNWSDWTSDTATSGSIDWANLGHCPLTLAYEALRQALAERVSATGADLADALDYPALITSGVEIGVDMDMMCRLEALSDAVWGLAPASTDGALSKATFADPSDYAGWATKTDMNQGLNRDVLETAVGARITETGSGAWAKQLKDALDAMYLPVSQPDQDTGNIVRLAYGEQKVVGPYSLEWITVTAATFADRQAAMTAAAWVTFVPSGTFPNVPFGTDNFLPAGHAERWTPTWDFPAVDKSRQLSVWFLKNGVWPTLGADGFLALGGEAAATAAAASVQVARNKQLIENGIWLNDGIAGIENYDVAGGFVFLD